jgi:hypothetical protein
MKAPPPSTSEVPTEEEIQWALAIQQAAKEDPDINVDLLTDLECMQHAIIAKANVTKALARIKRMQQFKSKYGIKLNGSYEEAVRAFLTAKQRHEGFFLSLATLPNDDTHISCTNYACFMAREVRSDEYYAVVMRGEFYILQAMFPTLAAIRAGTIMLSDGKGYGVLNYSFKLEERMAQLFSNAYPMRVKKMVMMNANWLMVVLQYALNAFMSKKMRKVRHLAGPRETYLAEHRSEYPPTVLPVEWGGTLPREAYEETVIRNLQQRYQLEETFRFPKSGSSSSSTCST